MMANDAILELFTNGSTTMLLIYKNSLIKTDMITDVSNRIAQWTEESEVLFISGLVIWRYR